MDEELERARKHLKDLVSPSLLSSLLDFSTANQAGREGLARAL